MYPEPQQAIYTRCHAPYSITGREGFGWRYVDAGMNLALLEEILPYATYRRGAQSAGISAPMLIYTILYGYKVMLHSIPVLDDLRGGNYLAQMLLARPGQLNACDAILNLWVGNFWLKKDVHAPDWRPPNVNRLLRHQRGHIAESTQAILNRAVSILEASPAGLDATLDGLDYLVQYACQRALLIRGTEDQIRACMTLLLFSLPASLAAHPGFVTNVRALNLYPNPRPVLLGWPCHSDASAVSRPNSLSDAKLIDLLAGKNADTQASHSLFSQTVQKYWQNGAVDLMQKRMDQLQDWCGTTNLVSQTDRCLYQGLAVAELMDDESKFENNRLPYHKLKNELLKQAIVLTPAELARIMRHLIHADKLALLPQEPTDTFLADYHDLIRQAGRCMMRVRLLTWLTGLWRGSLCINHTALHQWLMKPANIRILEASLDCYLRKMQDKDRLVLDHAQIDAEELLTWLADWTGDKEPAHSTNRWLVLGIIWYGLQKEAIATDELVDQYAAFKQALRKHKIKLHDHEMARVILYLIETQGEALLDNPPDQFLTDCRRLIIRRNGPSFWKCLVMWVRRKPCREKYLWSDEAFGVWLCQSNRNIVKLKQFLKN